MKKIFKLTIALLLVAGLSAPAMAGTKKSKSRTTKTTVTVGGKSSKAKAKPSYKGCHYYGSNTLTAIGSGVTLYGGMELSFNETGDYCSVSMYVDYGGQRLNMGSSYLQCSVSDGTIFMPASNSFPDMTFDYNEDMSQLTLRRCCVNEGGKQIIMQGTFFK